MFQLCVHTGLPRKIDSQQQRLQEVRQPALQGLEERAFQVDGAGRAWAPGRTSPAEPQEGKTTSWAGGRKGWRGKEAWCADSAATPSKAGSGGKLSRNLLFDEKDSWWFNCTRLMLKRSLSHGYGTKIKPWCSVDLEELDGAGESRKGQLPGNHQHQAFRGKTWWKITENLMDYKAENW